MGRVPPPVYLQSTPGELLPHLGVRNQLSVSLRTTRQAAHRRNRLTVSSVPMLPVGQSWSWSRGDILDWIVLCVTVTCVVTQVILGFLPVQPSSFPPYTWLSRGQKPV